MSTLINLVIAIAASLLTLTGVLRDTPEVPETQIMQCKQNVEDIDTHFIIENEELSQLIK
ncbi:MAG: hypothetical protein KJO05_00285 [Bacteroidia bacterium]|nr:hypothetical protein [Bacteroidia bacterium]NNF30859.1 hypothetical protein [Flavobacteriaceae bacterium]MBT8275434.1 hypothetical protein [Bacteroidia bacterium]NNJ81946.1 hypothetical protein [Flavobacteriaceae bacterium]NNK54472.1 hypothetical protein [Flavobacteriaceae bacterium]